MLNFNGPQRVRPLLANKEEEEAADEEQGDEDKEKLHVEAKAVMVFSSSSLDEHIIEYLPPTLHKGNVIQTVSLSNIYHINCFSCSAVQKSCFNYFGYHKTDWAVEWLTAAVLHIVQVLLTKSVKPCWCKCLLEIVKYYFVCPSHILFFKDSWVKGIETNCVFCEILLVTKCLKAWFKMCSLLNYLVLINTTLVNHLYYVFYQRKAFF